MTAKVSSDLQTVFTVLLQLQIFQSENYSTCLRSQQGKKMRVESPTQWRIKTKCANRRKTAFWHYFNYIPLLRRRTMVFQHEMTGNFPASRTRTYHYDNATCQIKSIQKIVIYKLIRLEKPHSILHIFSYINIKQN